MLSSHVVETMLEILHWPEKPLKIDEHAAHPHLRVTLWTGCCRHTSQREFAFLTLQGERSATALSTSASDEGVFDERWRILRHFPIQHELVMTFGLDLLDLVLDLLFLSLEYIHRLSKLLHGSIIHAYLSFPTSCQVQKSQAPSFQA